MINLVHMILFIYYVLNVIKSFIHVDECWWCQVSSHVLSICSLFLVIKESCYCHIVHLNMCVVVTSQWSASVLTGKLVVVIGADGGVLNFKHQV